MGFGENLARLQKATGETAEKVDELSRLIVRECPNRAAVSDQLQAVIECKRKA